MDSQLKVEWFVELNGEKITVDSIGKLRNVISRAESLQFGRLWVGGDGGLRPWWHKIFGMTRFTDSFLSLEWHDGYAALIFYDENGSEYRAMDKEYPIQLDDEIRSRISHGNAKPSPSDEFMRKDRSFTAIYEYFSTNTMPTWLSYRFVR